MRKILSVFIFFIMAIPIIAQNNSTFVTLNGKSNQEEAKPQKELIEDRIDFLSVKYQFPGFFLTQKVENQDQYQIVRINSFGFLQEVGKPSLPVFYDIIVVPENSQINIDYKWNKKIERNDILVYPTLEPASDEYGAPEPKFEIDEDFYMKNELYPKTPVEVIKMGKVKGMQLAMVRVSPIQYNPAQRKLVAYDQLQYNISFSNAGKYTNYENLSYRYRRVFSRYVLNAQSFWNEISTFEKTESRKYDPKNPAKDYIIVTHGDYLSAADSLAKWKMQLGFDVEILSKDSWTAPEIKDSIHQRYHNWTPKPDYFVIIGDQEDVPGEIHQAYDGDDYATDLFFSTMDGASDYMSDIAHGRISVSDSAEAMNTILKIINYERYPVVDSAFYSHGLSCAQFQDVADTEPPDGYAARRFTHTSEEIRDYLMGQGYDMQRIYYTESVNTPTHYNNGYYSPPNTPIPNELLKSSGFSWNGGANHITNAINAGRFFVFHRDHGYAGGSGWAHPQYQTNHIGMLTNGNLTPVVFSINCHTGAFMENECFSEKFIRQEGGAVGVFGASQVSYSGYNDALSLGMVDGVWASPGLTGNFGSGGSNNPGNLPHADNLPMGDVLDYGLIRMAQMWFGNNQIVYSNKIFHYFGDPSMRMWRAYPKNLSCLVGSMLICDSSRYVYNCTEDSVLISIVAEGKLLGKVLVEGGADTLKIDPISTENAVLTISKPGFKTLFYPYRISKPLYVTTEVTPESGSQCSGQAQVFANGGTPPLQYEWSTDPVSNATSVDGLCAGSYTVKVTDDMGCYKLEEIYISGIGINQANDNEHFSVFPIPSNDGVFTFEWKTVENKPNLIRVYNIEGKEIHTRYVDQNAFDGSLKLDLSSQGKGFYQIIVLSESGHIVFSKRLIVGS